MKSMRARKRKNLKISEDWKLFFFRKRQDFIHMHTLIGNVAMTTREIFQDAVNPIMSPTAKVKTA